MNIQQHIRHLNNLKLMKIVVILMVVFVVSCTFNKKEPQFYFTNSTYDFGYTEGNEVLKTTFSIKNLFDVPLKIIDIKSSCKCVTTTHTKTLVKPNESMEIQVAFDTKGFSGKQKKLITIETDNEYHRYLRFSVQTKIAEW
ncbi:hypothetical protein KORDIASMS9_04397 [Kordia sp. SMS9]|uniref:DUF1573 domain-containing protein n=1 Tax=Kordia sp. SMS9 TaxID=2282170 RepID=UPI000E0D0F39|nr:DUF1573 domain-containing protein [Kordia sp. SMS9]AXG72134.1 hypothetical protein KORDIASMS9_04397 [Kordia sp. SMS9]